MNKALYVQFATPIVGGKTHIHKWSFEPFDGSQFYALVCDCIAPDCPLHGSGTRWAAECTGVDFGRIMA